MASHFPPPRDDIQQFPPPHANLASPPQAQVVGGLTFLSAPAWNLQFRTMMKGTKEKACCRKQGGWFLKRIRKDRSHHASLLFWDGPGMGATHSLLAPKGACMGKAPYGSFRVFPPLRDHSGRWGTEKAEGLWVYSWHGWCASWGYQKITATYHVPSPRN